MSGDLGTLVLKVKLAQTRRFISERPDEVVLTRSSVVSDGQGGFITQTPSPLLPQRMRMIPTRSVTEEAPVRVSTSGQTVTPNWFLVSMPDADIHIGDTATVRGHIVEVVYVMDIPDDRLVAECWENLENA